MNATLAIDAVQGFYSTTQFLVFAALALGSLMALGFAAFFGGDHGVEHDLGGADHDASDSGGTGAPSFLSPRVFFAFALGFGTTGAGATAYGVGPLAASGIGIIPGFVMSLLAWSLGYVLYKQQANSSLRPGQAVGCTGTVTTAIPAGGIGEVNLKIQGQVIPYTAMANDATVPISAGTLVTVVKDLGDKIMVKKAAS